MPYPLPDPAWPTPGEAERSRLFSPVRVGAFTSRNRGWVPAMVPWRASEDGAMTQDVIDWYGRFADGRPGVLVVEATGIRDVPSGPLLRIGHDRFVDGMRALVDKVRERSGGHTKLLIQIIDFLRIRRRPEKEAFVRRFLEVDDALRERLTARPVSAPFAAADPADVAEHLLALPHEDLLELLDERQREALEYGARERVTDTHLPHIEELPRVLPGLFSDAAARAMEAGFDGVELHYAHAYTMASFLSARNDRTDGYGGSPEARVRLPLEILAAVRARVGPHFTVGCRLLGDEAIDAGSAVADAQHYSKALCEAGLDFVSVSKGGKFEDARQPKVGAAAYPYTGPSGHECMPTVRIEAPGPFGRNLHLARSIRSTLRAAGLTQPVIGAGGLSSYAQLEAALQEGDCDLVGAARQSLADPDWWLKIRTGAGPTVRRCIFTNYCEGLDQKHKQVTCQLWDKDLSAPDRTGDIAMSNDGKRRLLAPPN